MRKPLLRNEDTSFSEREKRVFSLFWKAGFNEDIAIDAMFNKYHGAMRWDNLCGPRQRQMSIGMVVTRINRKLKGTKIVPGALKRTYRLTQV